MQSAEEALSDTKLFAPTTGTIVSLSGEVGEAVSASGTTKGSSSSSGSGSSGSGSSSSAASAFGASSAATGASGSGSSGSGSSSSSSSFAVLSDLSSMQLVVPLSESEVIDVRDGQPATVTIEALEGLKLAAHVVSVATLPTSSSGVVSYDVTFQLDQLESGLKPGMSATAEVVVKQAEGVNVPTSAITADTVTVVHGGTQTRRRVVTGLAGNSSTIILSGLSAGEQIVLPVARSPPRPPASCHGWAAARGRSAAPPGVSAQAAARRSSAARAEAVPSEAADAAPTLTPPRACRAQPAARGTYSTRRPPRLHPASVIDVRDVSKTYAIGTIRVPALRGVSLRIERGDFVAIMGSSGSGKSTLMNILGCLDIPTSGRYLIDGTDAHDLDEDELSDLRNRKLGFVFQSFNLVARTPALANVELPLAYAGLHRAERRRRAERALASVGMANRVHHLPSELSGGQQQRVAVARAIVTNPSLILADEPTGNLDSHSTEDVLAIFADLNAEGRTVVLITHEPDVAAQAKRVVRLSDGQIVEDQPLSSASTTAPPASHRLKSGHLARPGQRRSHDRRRDAAHRLGRDHCQQAPLGADDPRHDDRRRLGDHPDRGRQRLLQSGRGTDREPRHQRAAGRVRRHPRRGALRRRRRRAPVSLTKQDAAALQNHSEAPDVKSASPVVNATGVTLVYNGTSYEPGTFVGTTPSYLAAHGYHLQEGTAFTEADVAHHARVAVIGQTVVEELFPGQDPIGQTMRANGVNFEVIGVLAAKGSNGVSNLDEIVAAPITTVQDSLSGYGPIDSITVEATSESALSSAEAEVTQILEQRHTRSTATRPPLPKRTPPNRASR